jgi:hypothetical protein
MLRGRVEVANSLATRERRARPRPTLRRSKVAPHTSLSWSAQRLDLRLREHATPLRFVHDRHLRRLEPRRSGGWEAARSSGLSHIPVRSKGVGCSRVIRRGCGAAEAPFSLTGRCGHWSRAPTGPFASGSQSPRPRRMGFRCRAFVPLHFRRRTNRAESPEGDSTWPVKNCRLLPTAPHPTVHRAATGPPLSRVCRSLTRLYKEQFGRSPESAHAYFVGPDALICCSPIRSRPSRAARSQWANARDCETSG